MLHIFLTILKIPFILLAVLLLLVLVLFLLLLFVPLRYQAEAKKDSEVSAAAKISWLLHCLTVHVSYADRKPELTVKILGYPLIGRKKKQSAKGGREKLKTSGKPGKRPSAAKKKKAQPRSKKAETLKPREQTNEPSKTSKSHVQTNEPSQTSREERPRQNAREDKSPSSADKRREWRDAGKAKEQPVSGADEILQDKTDEPRWRERIRSIGARVHDLWRRILDVPEKIKNCFHIFLEKIHDIQKSIQKLKSQVEYYKDLWYDTHTQAAYRHIKKELRYLLGHYLPAKVEGHVLFGLDDPALTGQALGLLCVAQVFTGNHFQVQADFEQAMFAGDVFLKGHVRACHLVKVLLVLVLDAHCRVTFQRIRKIRNH